MFIHDCMKNAYFLCLPEVMIVCVCVWALASMSKQYVGAGSELLENL